MNEDEIVERLEKISEKWQDNRLLVKELSARVSALQIPRPVEVPQITAAEYDSRYGDIQRENQLLNQTIKQYETTLEILMTKFRSQAHSIQKEKHDLQLKLEHTLQEERVNNTSLKNENTILQEQLSNCLRVMREALNADDVNVDVVLGGMAKENETLRQMLHISGVDLPQDEILAT
ncbi:hypothetical protein DFS34DRAFT_632722 [Phlyctochytrium arcticum]|nr:hypothetical protein DFS34DRAFT_632722 [Phlyctochytrium arcticum]